MYKIEGFCGQRRCTKHKIKIFKDLNNKPEKLVVYREKRVGKSYVLLNYNVPPVSDRNAVTTAEWDMS